MLESEQTSAASRSGGFCFPFWERGRLARRFRRPAERQWSVVSCQWSVVLPISASQLFSFQLFLERPRSGKCEQTGCENAECDVRRFGDDFD